MVCGAFPLWGFYLLWFVGLLIVGLFFVGFFDLMSVLTGFFVGFFLVGLFVMGFFHCGVFIYCGLWGFLVCLWGFYNPNLILFIVGVLTGSS